MNGVTVGVGRCVRVGAGVVVAVADGIGFVLDAVTLACEGALAPSDKAIVLPALAPNAIAQASASAA